MKKIENLINAKKPFLTDGGFETWLFFQQGFEAPEFAALVLLDEADARLAMRRYFNEFLGMAEAAGTGYVLDTNSWRAATAWGPKLGKTEGDMLRLAGDAVSFAQEIRGDWQDRVTPILVNGVVGPLGDGYAPDRVPTADEARRMHLPQIEVMSEAGVDMISAITMTNVGEAVGITKAGTECGVPVVISYTVETDGRLPGGESLGSAIGRTDDATGNAPLYYMVNCAHPDHFRHALNAGESWIGRIGGIRANASRLSHAELDVAEELDDGNPEEFGDLYAKMSCVLPSLKVVGGCCGTDHRHVGCVSRHLHGVKSAA
ncbi:homocysteine S-methyltransferase family protein [Nisaea acidiphila]|uniref:Homocysteine S-methyltransferase family protein n=1 Tax=Nisaea acidiphila TaxID=1862145 RepID=A0A9J7AUD1_9PROT|nr:homocysteine S-methyltransferase family protein [Nisaea acidiphila]UUX50718.1 homocysteine S-methyltransferase family protein [Nisaea acidiphila]